VNVIVEGADAQTMVVLLSRRQSVSCLLDDLKLGDCFAFGSPIDLEPNGSAVFEGIHWRKDSTGMKLGC
jgi:hypothetical protein